MTNGQSRRSCQTRYKGDKSHTHEEKKTDLTHKGLCHLILKGNHHGDDIGIDVQCEQLRLWLNAFSHGRPWKTRFLKIDTDSSGGLDQTELKAMLEKGPKGVNGPSSDDLMPQSTVDAALTTSSGMELLLNDEK